MTRGALAVLAFWSIAAADAGAAVRDWVTAWAVPPTTAKSNDAGSDQSFRMIVHPTVGGDAVRIRLSNAYGEHPVMLTSFSVARRVRAAAIEPATARPLTFGGEPTITLPARGAAVSDPVPFRYRYGEDLAVTFHLPGATAGPMTGHGFTAEIVTSYMTPRGTGDATSDATGEAFTETTSNKYFLMGLDAELEDAQGTVVAFGDSITDGTASTPNGYDTWPDVLAGRLNAAGMRVGVVNAGIAGNTVTDCPVSDATFGEAAVERFERDALSFPNVRAVIVHEGGNDLRFCPGATADSVSSGLRDIVGRAQAAGVRVLLGTYVPRVGRAIFTPTGDEERVKLNEWIRAQTGRAEAVVDFDRALDDPSNPGNMRPEADSGDGIHPGPTGLRTMGNLVPLDALLDRPAGTAAASSRAADAGAAPVAVVPRAAAATRRRATTIAARIRSRRAGRRLTVSTSGRIAVPDGVTAGEACTGSVDVQVHAGRRTVSTRRGRVQGDCTFASSVTFRRATRRSLRVTVRFRGNRTLLPRTSKGTS